MYHAFYPILCLTSDRCADTANGAVYHAEAQKARHQGRHEPVQAAGVERGPQRPSGEHF